MDVKNFNFVYEKYGSVRRDERELQVEMMNWMMRIVWFQNSKWSYINDCLLK
jgi:hypothetical protein